MEPARVAALVERDPVPGIDRLGTALLEFPGVQCAFSYATQLVPRQTMQFLGTAGRLEVESPFDAPDDRPCRLLLYDGAGRGLVVSETIEVAAAVLDGAERPAPLEDGVLDMRVIDAVRRAAEGGTWEQP